MSTPQRRSRAMTCRGTPRASSARAAANRKTPSPQSGSQWVTAPCRPSSARATAQAAARETIEETGWSPGPLRHLVSYHPTNGTSDQKFHLFIADGATNVGDPTDPGESERIEWVPLHEVRAIAERGEMTDGLSLS